MTIDDAVFQAFSFVRSTAGIPIWETCMHAPFYQLMLVTHCQHRAWDDYLSFIKTCATAGVTCVQLREKDEPLDRLFHMATTLQGVLKPLRIPLMINDHVELAVAVDAAGVHLGHRDACPQAARQALGPEKIIGVSLESIDDLLRANQQTVDYVAASAVFPTVHKSNIRTHWGLDGLRVLAHQSRHPLIGIGGIDEHTIEAVMAAGAKGVAVIGAIHQAADPVATIQTLRALQR